jgi:hypothetical protein
MRPYSLISVRLLRSELIPDLPKHNDKHDYASNKPRDDQNKTQNLPLQRCHACLRLTRQLGNAPKDRTIASSNAYTDAGARNAMSTLHADVLCLEVIVFGEIHGGIDGLRFT